MSKFGSLLGQSIGPIPRIPDLQVVPTISGWLGLTAGELLQMVPWRRWRSGCKIRLKFTGQSYGILNSAVRAQDAIVLVQIDKNLNQELDSTRLHDLLRAVKPETCIGITAKGGLVAKTMTPVLGWNVDAGFWRTKCMHALMVGGDESQTFSFKPLEIAP